MQHGVYRCGKRAWLVKGMVYSISIVPIQGTLEQRRVPFRHFGYHDNNRYSQTHPEVDIMYSFIHNAVCTVATYCRLRLCALINE